MYLPRSLISHLYLRLVATQHPLSPPVLILAALEPDALCACRIFTGLLKRDYIPHKIKPISGYGDLMSAGEDMIRPMRLSEGGTGGVVVCLGVGALISLSEYFGLGPDDREGAGADGVNVWIMDSRRPYNLNNVFGSSPSPVDYPLAESQNRVKAPAVDRGQISKAYKPDSGGVIVFDDGDIEGELAPEREAYFELEGMRSQLEQMPEGADEDTYRSDSDSEGDDEGRVETTQTSPGQKRKSWDREDSDDDDDESDKENSRPRQRRRSNTSSPIPSEPHTPSRGGRTHTRVSNNLSPPSNQLSSQPRESPEPVRPTARQQRRRFFRRKRKFDSTIFSYHTLGTSYSEPVSSLMYSLVSELGREDNDLLWLAIVGVSSAENYGRTPSGLSIVEHDRPLAATGWHGSREARIRQLLRDEVRRLNPPELTETGREVLRGHAGDAIPIHARSPTDTGIQLSPEPRFLLIRHWSLYDSMLHSPYLSAKLHIWSDAGRRRLHKLLAKMGISLSQCKQSYTHMDMDLKKVLRERLLHVAPTYGLEGLVPPATNTHGEREGWGFVRSWGWKACLSAADVATVIGAMLEVGQRHLNTLSTELPPPDIETATATANEEAQVRFYTAYDALLSPTRLTAAIPLAQTLHRAILRTGTSILQKRQVRHLNAFRMAILKEGPDLSLFTAPGALIKLALWLGEAVAQVEPERRFASKKALTPLVLGCLDETRDLYVVVGLGGGAARHDPAAASKRKAARDARREARASERAGRHEERTAAREERRRAREARAAARAEAGEHSADEDDETEEEPESDSSSDSESSADSDEGEGDEVTARRRNRNRFGVAFGEVAEETRARVRQDSFEHSVIEVLREDLSDFLERLAGRSVVG